MIGKWSENLDSSLLIGRAGEYFLPESTVNDTKYGNKSPDISTKSKQDLFSAFADPMFISKPGT